MNRVRTEPVHAHIPSGPMNVPPTIEVGVVTSANTPGEPEVYGVLPPPPSALSKLVVNTDGPESPKSVRAGVINISEESELTPEMKALLKKVEGGANG